MRWWHRARRLVVAAMLPCGLACDPGPGREACYGLCGEGTVCEAARCVAAPPAAEPTEPERDRKRSPRRKRKADATLEGSSSTPFVPVDDRHVPRYDPNETQVIGEGSERLPDETIRAHLERLEPSFNACIRVAAEHSDEDLAPGRIDFEFGIRPTGKVAGVNVKAPAHLRVFGIVPCLRNTLHAHRFPSYDGPVTGVDYSFRAE